MNRPAKRAEQRGLVSVPKTDDLDSTSTLVNLVRTSLADWASWVDSTKSGLMTPVQFLAVVLWALSNEKTTAADEDMIVKGWGKALLNAVQQQIIVAVHPVTLLPIGSTDNNADWRFSVNHANHFLENMPIGFDCQSALNHWYLEAARHGADDAGTLTYGQAKSQRKDGKKSTWTMPQINAVLIEIERRRGDSGVWRTIASELGIKEQTLRSNLKGKGAGERPPRQSSVQVQGNTISGNVWKDLTTTA